MTQVQILSDLFNAKNVITCYSIFLVVHGTRNVEGLQSDDVNGLPELCGDTVSAASDDTLGFDNEELPLSSDDFYKEYYETMYGVSPEISSRKKKTSNG